MAVPTAYGSSQASGGIRAAAQAYTTATATATATATLDPSLICDLPHSSRQCQVLDPGIEPASSGMLAGSLPLSHNGNSLMNPFILILYQ